MPQPSRSFCSSATSSTGTGRFGNTTNPTTTLLGSAALRSAATLTWDGRQGNGNWDSYNGYAANQSNWNLNNIPATGLVDTLTFAGSTQTSSTNNISGLTTGSIVFAAGASGFTNSGNSLTLTVGVSNSSSNLQTISHALVLASGTRGFDAASDDLTNDGVSILTASGLTYGGTMTLAFGGSAIANNTTFEIFDFAGSAGGSLAAIESSGFYAGTWTPLGSGTFRLISGAQTLTFSQTTGDVIVVPEPAALAVAAVGLGTIGLALLRRRRQACATT